MSRKYINYCEDSTITEAWAVITGVPGPVIDYESGFLEGNAEKNIGELTPIPSLVIVKNSEENSLVPPYWHKQLSWNQGKHLARIGHRYLSVHFIKKGEEKYGKYEDTLLPEITEWIESYKETVAGQKKMQYPIERASFGYSNLFKFPTENFDLSRYFKVGFSTAAESTSKGLARLGIDFTIQRKHVFINVNIGVNPDPTGSDTIIVTTRVEGHMNLDRGFTFQKNEAILKAIYTVKEAAKLIFFDLATDETHTFMSAKHA